MGRIEMIETQMEEDDDQSDNQNFETSLKKSMNRKRTINDNRLTSSFAAGNQSNGDDDEVNVGENQAQ